MHSDFYAISRYLNVVLAASVIVLAIVKATRWWPSMLLPRRLMYSGYVGMMFATVYGTLEQLIENIQPGFRISFTTAALILSVTAFLWPDPDTNWMLWWYNLRDKIRRR